MKFCQISEILFCNKHTHTQFMITRTDTNLNVKVIVDHTESLTKMIASLLTATSVGLESCPTSCPIPWTIEYLNCGWNRKKTPTLRGKTGRHYFDAWCGLGKPKFPSIRVCRGFTGFNRRHLVGQYGHVVIVCARTRVKVLIVGCVWKTNCWSILWWLDFSRFVFQGSQFLMICALRRWQDGRESPGWGRWIKPSFCFLWACLQQRRLLKTSFFF